jgi:protein tyrosine phosphatase (PTP) superfamily phosphohydrolase (DUF442 family)
MPGFAGITSAPWSARMDGGFRSSGLGIARVDAGLLRGPAPEGRHWKEIVSAGAKSVVSLQREGQSEADVAKLYGLKALRIPITDHTPPTLAQVQRFLDFASKPANQPVFVHCLAGQGRTGAMVACYRIAVNGWSLAAALKEARSKGMSLPSQVALVESFAKRLRAGLVPGFPRR